MKYTNDLNTSIGVRFDEMRNDVMVGVLTALKNDAAHCCVRNKDIGICAGIFEYDPLIYRDAIGDIIPSAYRAASAAAKWLKDAFVLLGVDTDYPIEVRQYGTTNSRLLASYYRRSDKWSGQALILRLELLRQLIAVADGTYYAG